MDLGEIFVIGVALFVIFIFFAVWRTECYDESESFLYNVGVLIGGLILWLVIVPTIIYALLGGCAKPY